MTPTLRDWAEAIAEHYQDTDLNLFLVTTEDTLREVDKNGRDEERRTVIAFLREAARGWAGPGIRGVIMDLADDIAEGTHVLRAETGDLDALLGEPEDEPRT